MQENPQQPEEEDGNCIETKPANCRLSQFCPPLFRHLFVTSKLNCRGSSVWVLICVAADLSAHSKSQLITFRTVPTCVTLHGESKYVLIAIFFCITIFAHVIHKFLVLYFVFSEHLVPKNWLDYPGADF